MHTKGLWVVYVETLDKGGWATPEQNITISSGDVIVASYSTGYSEYPDDSVNAANARLIAAAPDLLRELEHLVMLLEPLEQNGGLNVPGLATLNAARAAIAKATGGQ